MWRIGQFVASTIVLLSTAQVWADGHYDRRDGRAGAYQAGFGSGYRNGLRHGEFDFRGHQRYEFRDREYYRGDGFYAPEFRYKGDYKKGYRDGYRQGYREGYREYRRHNRDRREYYRFPY